MCQADTSWDCLGEIDATSTLDSRDEAFQPPLPPRTLGTLDTLKNEAPGSRLPTELEGSELDYRYPGPSSGHLHGPVDW